MFFHSCLFTSARLLAWHHLLHPFRSCSPLRSYGVARLLFLLYLVSFCQQTVAESVAESLLFFLCFLLIDDTEKGTCTALVTTCHSFSGRAVLSSRVSPIMVGAISVLTDPTTYGILSSELTNCPRTAAVLGELAAQWQQMMATLQRVEQEIVSSQSLVNATENMSQTPGDSTRGRLRSRDGERLYPKSWWGSAPLGGFAREVAAWLGCVDPKHKAGKLIQRITKGTLGATEAWIGDNSPGWDYELAVDLANVTKGAARATVLEVTQAEPSHGFVALAGTG